MTEILQHGICCFATSKLKVRLKNYFALGCSHLPFGFCVSRSLRFNNTWLALPLPGALGNASQQEVVHQEGSHSKQSSRYTHARMKMQILNGLGWIPQIIAHINPGYGASSLTDPSPQQHRHEAQVVKSPRATLPRPVLQQGDQSLSEAAGRPHKEPGGCEVTWVEEGWLLPTSCQGSRPLPDRSARDPAPVRTFPRMPDELWMSQPEFFHTLPLLRSAHCQLSCGFQPLSGPNASNIYIKKKKIKKIAFGFLTECSLEGHGESQCLCSVRPSHP